MALPWRLPGRTSPSLIHNSGDFPRVSTTLCERCASLNLSQHKFTARETATAPPATVLTTFDSVGFDPTDLGFLDEIYHNRVTCSFCRLIYNATHSDKGPGIGHDGLDADGRRVRCRIEWHLDSRSTDAAPTTRRMRVFNEDEKFAEIYVLPISPTSGRIKDDSAADPQLMSKWLTSCLTNHANCREHQIAGSAPFTHGIRVVDVNVLCLRQLSVEQLSSSQTSYAALSYVWGRWKQFGLSNSNCDALHEPWGLEPFQDKLPRTVLHAILVTRQLGIAYIWVDVLCINQDDLDEKLTQIRIMDRIYQRAVLTICVAVGDDSDAGIPGVGTCPRSLRQNLEICGGLQLTTLKPVASLIQASRWDTRAWTFQERLLSTRCAIFTGEGVVWQCPTTTWREDIQSALERTIWTLDSVGSPLRALLGNPLRSFSSCVNLYSGRNLTYIMDKLNAFNGLSEVLGRGLRSQLLFGLPSRYFDWGLLWEAESAGRRIDPATSLSRTDANVFPSWSWCGWNHQVDWRLSTVGGPLLNLHSWLTDHTWVVWYVGGDDRWELVWDSARDSADVDTTEPKPIHRWDGYSSGERDPYGRSENGAGCRHRTRMRTGLTTGQGDPLSVFPSRKGHLLFQTFTAYFSLSRRSMSKSVFQSNLRNNIRRFGITDKRGDWCGTVILDDEWLNSVDGIFEFAAISEAKEFTLEELDTWTYYIPEERQQAEWYCFYCLMLKWVDGGESSRGPVAERVGLAKIYQSSFFSASFGESSWKWITLQ